MQKNIIGASLVGSLVIILASFSFYDKFLLFLLIGAIPGTSETLSPQTMSIIISLCAAVIIALGALPRITSKSVTAEKKSTQQTRRFSRL